VEKLRWLVGCLEMRSGDRLVEEHRMDLRVGSMLGMGRTTNSSGLLGYELTLIPSVVFEAPQHDYPQIVAYRRSGRDSVLAWIDGTRGGKRQQIEFPYRRVVCPSPKGAK
jgi:hypothetical protein